ncbi:hypothetical protein GGS24DRAFT_452887 [Hypoxylon argillaceum]|nr:hypothetical protein GGS24DRAFT_452887 [Hypoxylon argillaceum]
MSSGRTRSPARLSLDDKSKVYRQDSFGSDYSVKAKNSPTSPSSTWFQRTRSTSEGDHKSNFGTVNRYTHCGRHTDQYLFGGHSLSESIKDLLKKKD